MAFKEKYIDTIIGENFGAFTNGKASAYEICDMAVQITRGPIYIPEDQPFPDAITTAVAEDTGVVTVEVTFDAAPEADKLKVFASEVMEVSTPAIADTKATFTITPKAEAKGTYTNVIVKYLEAVKIFHINMLPKEENKAEDTPVVPEVDGIKKSDADVKVGETFKITVSTNASITSESDLTITTDDKIEEVTPFELVEGGMRSIGEFKAVKGGTSVVTAKTNAGKITHQLNIEISGDSGETPEPPAEEAEIKTITASPESIAIGQDSTITITFSKAPVGTPTLTVSEEATIKTELSVNEAVGTAVITGAKEGTAVATVKLGNGMLVRNVAVTQ